MGRKGRYMKQLDAWLKNAVGHSVLFLETPSHVEAAASPGDRNRMVTGQ